MCLKENILRSRFSPFLDDFRNAGATIVALCSQGLKTNMTVDDFMRHKLCPKNVICTAIVSSIISA